MAVAATFAGTPPSNTSTSNVASFANSTFTFVSGTLYILVNVFDDAEATAEVPSSVVLSGATPPTVTRVTAATATFNTVATPLHRATLWWWIGDGVSRTITVTMPDAGTGNIMYVVAVTGANNSAPIVQGAGNQGDAGTTASATLSAFAKPSNGCLVFAAHDTTNNITAEGGGAWTELNSGTDVSHTTPASRISAAFRTGEDTSPSMTIAASSDWGCVAVEIAIAPISVTANQSTETDLAQTVIPLRSRSVAQATETDLAQAITRTIVRVLAQTTETDLAQALTAVLSGQDVDVLQAVESDEAQLIRPAELHEVAQATETDLAQQVAWARAVAVAQAVETDEALSLGQSLEIGIATETDTARELDLFKGVAGSGVVRSPNRVRISARHNEVT